MSLLIGTISNKHAVITADGLSRPNLETGAGLKSDNFKKIFPVQNLPIAFAHHGFNILGGKQVDLFIDGYISSHYKIIATSSIKSVAEHLRSYAEQDALNVFNNPTNKGVIGFWIVGFNDGKETPELYEICWPDKPAPCEFRPLVLGGDGRDFLNPLPEHLGPFQHSRLCKYPIPFVLKYHQALYQLAESEQRKTAEIIFGGHQHQLLLEKTGWKWTKPPAVIE